MARKTRLTAVMRQRLTSLAQRIVSPAEAKKRMDDATAKAAPLVLAAVHTKYPPKDMKVLAKYGKASVDNCIKLQLPNGVVDIFNFPNDTGPLVAKKTSYGQMYSVNDSAVGKIIQDAIDAAEAFSKERKARVCAYAALIDGTTYLEDLVELWPEAAQVKGAFLPIALGPEQVELIKRDVDERKAVV